jgi:hypothetical protein
MADVYESESRTKTPVLWYELLSGPIIWSVYFLAGYLLAELACRIDILPGTLFGMNALSGVLILLTLAALGASVLAGLHGYRTYKKHSRVNEPNQPEEMDIDARNRFMALSGLILNVLFVFLILLTGYPLLVLNPCIFGP